jgi:hypothetical protein
LYQLIMRKYSGWWIVGSGKLRVDQGFSFVW